MAPGRFHGAVAVQRRGHQALGAAGWPCRGEVGFKLELAAIVGWIPMP